MFSRRDEFCADALPIPGSEYLTFVCVNNFTSGKNSFYPHLRV
jgi:hypothetical protein